MPTVSGYGRIAIVPPENAELTKDPAYLQTAQKLGIEVAYATSSPWTRNHTQV